MWNATPPVLPVLGPRVGPRTQWAAARDARRVIDEIAEEIDRSLRSTDDRALQRDALRRRIERFGRERLGWPTGHGEWFASDDFCSSTAAFLREAHAFDPGMPVEQLCQALRNVWVGNSLQTLLGWPVRLGPALFAYSMLYPVTDNWLDDPRVSSTRKCAFNERLGARLKGRSVQADDEREARAYRLVARIENDLPRARYPYAYASLLAIHTSQCRSLEQQDGRRLSDDELLTISVAKGGTSVLANLFLIGADEPSAIPFAFGYGVALQLLDDLQDLETDLAAGHETLFTRAARRGVVDETAERLGRFISAALLDAGAHIAVERKARVDLIRRHCVALLVDSVAAQPKRFSRAFRARVGARWPVSLRAQRRLARRAAKLTQRAAAALLTDVGRASIDGRGHGAAAEDPVSTPSPISAIMLRRGNSQ